GEGADQDALHAPRVGVAPAQDRLVGAEDVGADVGEARVHDVVDGHVVEGVRAQGCSAVGLGQDQVVGGGLKPGERVGTAVDRAADSVSFGAGHALAVGVGAQVGDDVGGN